MKKKANFRNTKLFIPIREYMDKVFYVWFQGKLHQARFAYTKPYYYGNGTDYTLLGSKLYIAIANVGVVYFSDDIVPYKSIEDYKDNQPMSLSYTLGGNHIDIKDVLMAIDNICIGRGKSNIETNGGITEMTRYFFDEESGNVKEVYGEFDFEDMTISNKGIAFGNELIASVAEFKNKTYSSVEECLNARNIDVVAFDDCEEENTLVLIAKGERAEKLAETIKDFGDIYNIGIVRL